MHGISNDLTLLVAMVELFHTAIFLNKMFRFSAPVSIEIAYKRALDVFITTCILRKLACVINLFVAQKKSYCKVAATIYLIGL